MESAKRIWTSQAHNNIPLNPYWTQGDVVMAGNGFLFVRAKIKILNLVALEERMFPMKKPLILLLAGALCLFVSRLPAIGKEGCAIENG